MRAVVENIVPLQVFDGDIVRHEIEHRAQHFFCKCKLLRWCWSLGSSNSALGSRGSNVRCPSYYAVYPSSTMISWPVVKPAPGELSQSTALAISSGMPMRPIGVWDAIVFFISVSLLPKAGSNISVWIGPGRHY